IRVRRGKAVIVKQEDKSRQEQRTLADEELRELRELVDDIRFDDLPALIYVPPANAHGALSYTLFVHVGKNGGRRVYTDTVYPDRKDKTPYQRFYNFFDRLVEAEGFKPHYFLEDRIEGLEVLYAGHEPVVENICMQNRELRVFVREQFQGT